MAALTVLAVALLGHGLVSGRLRGLAITGPMVFVAVGFLTGSEVFDVASFDLTSETVIVLAEATLAVVLFSDAVRVDLRQLRGFIGLPTRMLGLGLPLVIGAGTLTMRYVVDLSWARAALIASILAATDAALSQAVLTDEEVPRCVRGSLNVESGLNDGLALPAVTLFSALVADSEGGAASFWMQFLAEQIGFGILAGIVVGSTGGWLLVQASRKGWVEGISGQLAALSLVGLAFLSAHALGGNSFIAAFVAGVSFRAVGAEDAEHLSEFTEDSGQLLATLTFVVFGNALFGPAVDQLTVPIAISVVLSLSFRVRGGARQPHPPDPGCARHLRGLLPQGTRLIATRPFAPKLSAIGSMDAAFLFLVTLTFLIATPGAFQIGYGPPFLSPMPGQFVAKDVGLLAIAVWTAGEAIGAGKRA